jgi:hypothetical protein
MLHRTPANNYRIASDTVEHFLLASLDLLDVSAGPAVYADAARLKAVQHGITTLDSILLPDIGVVHAVKAREAKATAVDQ